MLTARSPQDKGWGAERQSLQPEEPRGCIPQSSPAPGTHPAGWARLGSPRGTSSASGWKRSSPTRCLKAQPGASRAAKRPEALPLSYVSVLKILTPLPARGCFSISHRASRHQDGHGHNVTGKQKNGTTPGTARRRRLPECTTGFSWASEGEGDGPVQGKPPGHGEKFWGALPFEISSFGLRSKGEAPLSGTGSTAV